MNNVADFTTFVEDNIDFRRKTEYFVTRNKKLEVVGEKIFFQISFRMSAFVVKQLNFLTMYMSGSAFLQKERKIFFYREEIDIVFILTPFFQYFFCFVYFF